MTQKQRPSHPSEKIEPVDEGSAALEACCPRLDDVHATIKAQTCAFKQVSVPGFVNGEARCGACSSTKQLRWEARKLALKSGAPAPLSGLYNREF